MLMKSTTNKRNLGKLSRKLEKVEKIQKMTVETTVAAEEAKEAEEMKRERVGAESASDHVRFLKWIFSKQPLRCS